MKTSKVVVVCAGFVAAFLLGYSAHASFGERHAVELTGHVTGVGGIFFKAENPQTLKEWYRDNLGLNIDEYGTNFQWYQGADSTRKGYTQWSVFKNKTTYFAPSEKDFMINYRVVNLDAMMERFRKNKVTVTDTIESYNYGRFVHIMDPEGNKIELWEPIDVEYGKFTGGITK